MNGTNVRTLFFILKKHFVPYWRTFVLLFILFAVHSASSIYLPFAMSAMITSLGEPANNISTSVLTVMTLGTISTLSAFVLNITKSIMANRISVNLRTEITNQIAFGEPKTVDYSNTSGQVITRLMEDTATLIVNLVNVFEIVLSIMSAIVTLIVLSYHFNYILCLILIGYVLLYLLMPVIFRRKFYRIQKSLKNSRASAISFVGSLLEGLEVTKLFSTTSASWMNSNAKDKWNDLSRITVKFTVARGYLSLVQQILNYSSICGLVLIGLLISKHGTTSVSEILAFVLYTDRIRGVASVAAESPNVFTSIQVSLERLREHIQFKPFKFPYSQNSKVASVDFHNVTVKIGERVLLEEANLSIPDSGTVIVTGDNGVGKSTLTKCLVGLQRLDKGYVTWNKAIEQNGGIAYVPQNVPVFNCSLYDNIVLGHDLMCENIEELLRMLGWTGELNLEQEFASASPPSGGQRKRIGLARAFLSNANVIILDEIESGLDKPDTIIQAIKDRFRLVVAVTHYPNLWGPDETIRFSDQVLVPFKDSELCFGGEGLPPVALNN
ncbi:ATP-binding cassette domain-containing protein [Alicyclobacillus sp. ALC3]|uniref:ATP-binding cassette domain-containing protein n=1 Tax=Alicyclobacillus sp. ALC3 TaxID=2796143 RepID=UPI0023787B28|nr:ABC transporter ATP-binding protein [Alicyclobacillus sp. ALC3]WDL97937.1 ABC transporter ATP-binding protein [Alicyclobacillus sp. ALC3]